MKRIIPIVLILLVSACGGDAADTTTTTAASSDDDAATTTAPTTTTTMATTTTAAPTTTTAPEPTAGECLVGTWALDSEAFVETINQQMGAEVPGEITAGGGTYDLEMDADGTFTTTRDEWRWVIESQEGSFIVQISGTESGTYEVDGNSISATTTGGETTVQTGIEVDGELQDLPFPIDMEFDTDAVSGSGTYECTDETLTIEVDGFTSVFRR